jgi:hypothetical protein
MTTLTASSRSIATGAPSADSSLSRRIIAVIVALACAGLLGLAAYMTPSPTGVGTHSQMNLPSCPWITMGDLPCPTCGMTTAFAHAADGHVLAALHAQPMGGLLAIATAMAFLVSVYVGATGSRIGSGLARLWTVRSGWILAGMVLLAWGYKIASYRGWIG